MNISIESAAAIAFVILMAIFLFIERKKIQVQKFASWLLYFAMYRTSAGLHAMDVLAKRLRRVLQPLSYIVIFLGFAGMALITYMMTVSFFKIFFRPEEAVGVGLVLPIEAKGVFYVPFFYWIISIFIIAAVHEFSHGVFARLWNLKVKSSGLAFLGVIVPLVPAAFVEPDERQIRKSPAKEQLSVYAAGPFANILLAFLVIGVASLLIGPGMEKIFEPDGVTVKGFSGNNSFPAERAGIRAGELVQRINNSPILFIEDFKKALDGKKPGEKISLRTNTSSYTIALSANPEDAGKGYLGIYVEQHTRVKPGFAEKYGVWVSSLFLWFAGLLMWLYILNLGIGLFNLVPLGPLDGGRMFFVALQHFFGDKKAKTIARKVSAALLLMLVVTLIFGFVRG
ncbi:site-2 protease family protein [Candidatus Woesearchaeota archaeon]|nr:site-2 protease family protein [Candidatus Woesearchaeota archaeon]